MVRLALFVFAYPRQCRRFRLFEGFGLTIDDLGWFAFVIALSVPIFYAVLGGYIGARWRRSHPPAAQTKP